LFDVLLLKEQPSKLLIEEIDGLKSHTWGDAVLLIPILPCGSACAHTKTNFIVWVAPFCSNPGWMVMQSGAFGDVMRILESF